MKARILVVAIVLAVLLTSAGIVTINAAAPHAGSSVAGRAFQLKGLGSTQFAPSRQVTQLADAPAKLQVTNRRIPTQVNDGKTRASSSYQVVTPQLLTTLGVTAKTARGLNDYNLRGVWGFNTTPPDQALCVGNGFVVEAVNLVWAVYDTSFNKLTADQTLDDFFGNTLDNLSDPKCYFDPYYKRFFMTILQYGMDNSGNFTFSQVLIAVSKTGDPRLGWNIYGIDTSDANLPGCPCLGDQPLMGANKDAFFVTTNQYANSSPWFYGANIYALDKKGLVDGRLATFINGVAWQAGKDIPTPDQGGIWYSVQPATSPVTSNWDTRQNGIGYMLSSLEFFGSGDTRIALWAATNTGALAGLEVPAPVLLNYTVVDTKSFYVSPPPGVQKNDGLLPALYYYYNNPALYFNTLSPIDSNDDRMNQTVFVNHTIWGALDTGVTQVINGVPEDHAGILYFGVHPSWDSGGNLGGTVVRKGYISARKRDVMYPSVALNELGRGAVAFSVTGANMYPSSGYALLGTTYGPTELYMNAVGQSSLDDFSWYQIGRPRFGDYSAAVVYNSKIFFASEYIQYPNCDVTTFAADKSCGGTRGNRTNWGTSLAKIAP